MGESRFPCPPELPRLPGPATGFDRLEPDEQGRVVRHLVAVVRAKKAGILGQRIERVGAYLDRVAAQIIAALADGDADAVWTQLACLESDWAAQAGERDRRAGGSAVATSDAERARREGARALVLARGLDEGTLARLAEVRKSALARDRARTIELLPGMADPTRATLARRALFRIWDTDAWQIGIREFDAPIVVRETVAALARPDKLTLAAWTMLTGAWREVVGGRNDAFDAAFDEAADVERADWMSLVPADWSAATQSPTWDATRPIEEANDF